MVREGVTISITSNTRGSGFSSTGGITIAASLKTIQKEQIYLGNEFGDDWSHKHEGDEDGLDDEFYMVKFELDVLGWRKSEGISGAAKITSL